MDLDEPFLRGTCDSVKTVNVLRDDEFHSSGLFERNDRRMDSVRPCRPKRLAVLQLLGPILDPGLVGWT